MSATSPSPSDEALALQTQSGSMEAFEELVLRYEKRIYAFISQSCRNSIDAAEITQETFVKAFQAIGQFDPTRIFAPWLFTIARRKCIDYFRSLKERHHQHSTPDPQSDHASASELSDITDPAEVLAQQEDRRNLWAVARRNLSQPQFDALWLHYVEDMGIAQISRILRRPQTYVKVLLFRARRTLGQRLKPTRDADIPVAVRTAVPPSESAPSTYEIVR
jgi:RNA polymerase sigma-70 factor, ECF subfamily